MTATLYSEYRNPDTRQTEWKRTVLSGMRSVAQPAIYWQESEGANVNRTGLTSADAVLVMIWRSIEAEGETYLSPRSFANLPADKVKEYWTVAKGSRLVLGTHEGATPPTPAEVDHCITVTRVDTWTIGSEYMQHLEVYGK